MKRIISFFVMLLALIGLTGCMGNMGGGSDPAAPAPDKIIIDCDFNAKAEVDYKSKVVTLILKEDIGELNLKDIHVRGVATEYYLDAELTKPAHIIDINEVKSLYMLIIETKDVYTLKIEVRGKEPEPTPEPKPDLNKVVKIEVIGLPKEFYLNEEISDFKVDVYLLGGTVERREMSAKDCLNLSTSEVGEFDANILGFSYHYIVRDIKAPEAYAYIDTEEQKYYVGDQYKGARLVVDYGTHKEYFELPASAIKKFDTSKPGSVNFEVSYKGYNAIMAIEVLQRPEPVYEIAELKTLYELNSGFIPGKLKVIVGDDISYEPLTIDMVEGFNTSTVGSKKIVINVAGNKINRVINVCNKLGTGINITPSTLTVDLKPLIINILAFNDETTYTREDYLNNKLKNENKALKKYNEYKEMLEALGFNDSDIPLLTAYIDKLNIEAVKWTLYKYDYTSLSAVSLIKEVNDSLIELTELLSQEQLATILGEHKKLEGGVVGLLGVYNKEALEFENVALKGLLDNLGDELLKSQYQGIKKESLSDVELMNMAAVLKDLFYQLDSLSEEEIRLATGFGIVSMSYEEQAAFLKLIDTCMGKPYMNMLWSANLHRRELLVGHKHDSLLSSYFSFINNNLDKFKEYVSSLDYSYFIGFEVREEIIHTGRFDGSLADACSSIAKLYNFFDSLRNDKDLEGFISSYYGRGVSVNAFLKEIDKYKSFNSEDKNEQIELINSFLSLTEPNSFSGKGFELISRDRPFDGNRYDIVINENATKEDLFKALDSYRLRVQDGKAFIDFKLDSYIDPNTILDTIGHLGKHYLVVSLNGVSMAIPVYVVGDSNIKRVISGERLNRLLLIIDSNNNLEYAYRDTYKDRKLDLEGYLKELSYNILLKDGTYLSCSVANAGMGIIKPAITRLNGELSRVELDFGPYSVYYLSSYIPSEEAKDMVTGIYMGYTKTNAIVVNEGNEPCSLEIGFGLKTIKDIDKMLSYNNIKPGIYPQVIVDNGISYHFNLRVITQAEADIKIRPVEQLNRAVNEDHLWETVFGDVQDVRFLMGDGYTGFFDGADLLAWIYETYGSNAEITLSCESKLFNNGHENRIKPYVTINIKGLKSDVISLFAEDYLSDEDYERVSASPTDDKALGIEVSDKEFERLLKLSDQELIDFVLAKGIIASGTVTYHYSTYEADDVLLYLKENKLDKFHVKRVSFNTDKDENEKTIINVSLDERLDSSDLFTIAPVSVNREEERLYRAEVDIPLVVPGDLASIDSLNKVILNNIHGIVEYRYTRRILSNADFKEFLKAHSYSIELSPYNNRDIIIKIGDADLRINCISFDPARISTYNELGLIKPVLTKDELANMHRLNRIDFVAYENTYKGIRLDLLENKEFMDNLVIEAIDSPDKLYYLFKLSSMVFNQPITLNVKIRKIDERRLDIDSLRMVNRIFLNDVNTLTAADLSFNAAIMQGNEYILDYDYDSLFKDYVVDYNRDSEDKRSSITFSSQTGKGNSFNVYTHPMDYIDRTYGVDIYYKVGFTEYDKLYQISTNTAPLDILNDIKNNIRHITIYTYSGRSTSYLRKNKEFDNILEGLNTKVELDSVTGKYKFSYINGDRISEYELILGKSEDSVISVRKLGDPKYLKEVTKESYVTAIAETGGFRIRTFKEMREIKDKDELMRLIDNFNAVQIDSKGLYQVTYTFDGFLVEDQAWIEYKF